MVKEHRLGDIIANSVTHGIGAALALAGALVLVYVCSTLYHSLVRTRARHVLRIGPVAQMDRAAVS